jgi:hypothetical protein
MRNACSPSAPFAGDSGTALTGAMRWLDSVTSGFGLEGPAQTSRSGVLGAESSKKLSKPELPAGISGLGSTDPGFQPNSARDWLRLFLFAVLGVSLVFAIRHTVRDLRH